MIPRSAFAALSHLRVTRSAASISAQPIHWETQCVCAKSNEMSCGETMTIWSSYRCSLAECSFGIGGRCTSAAGCVYCISSRGDSQRLATRNAPRHRRGFERKTIRSKTLTHAYHTPGEASRSTAVIPRHERRVCFAPSFARKAAMSSNTA